MNKYLPAILAFFLMINISFSEEPTPDWLEDITFDAGLRGAEGSRIVIADVNGDNYPDLLWGSGNINKNHYRLMINEPNPENNPDIPRIFVDRTEESNIDTCRNPDKDIRVIDVASFADVDNDGDLDLVTSIYYHRLEYYSGVDTLGNPRDPGDRSEVLLNNGHGKFSLVDNSGLTDVVVIDTLPQGLVNCTGLSFLDYDLDGNIDLYMATWFSDYRSNRNINPYGYKMQDVLFKGNGDGTFTRITNSGIDYIREPMYGVNATDYNNDGWSDIITSPYCRSSGSLFENNGDGTFTDVAQSKGYTSQLMGGDHGQPLCQWEAMPADFDNDGDMDLLQINVHGGLNVGEGRSHISINNGPENGYTYTWAIERIHRDAHPSGHLGDNGGNWFDLDGDGWLDLAICQIGYSDGNIYGQERLYICRQDENHFFNDISAQLGIKETLKKAHSIEPCDFDLDGDVDLFVSRQITEEIDGENVTHMQVCLLRNDVGNKNCFTSVKIKQPDEANQAGIGSRIYVCSGDNNQIRELQAGLGHFANQHPFVQNVGLGKYNRVDSIIVNWPVKDAEPTIVYNPPKNLMIEIDKNGYTDYVKTWDGDKPVAHFNVAAGQYDTVQVSKSKQLTFSIKNIGDAPMEVNSASFENNEHDAFDLEGLTFPFTIESNNEIDFTVSFSPYKRQKYLAQIVFQTNAVNGAEHPFDLEGYGFKEKPVVVLSTDTLDFGSAWIGESDEKKLTIYNKGEELLEVSSFSIEYITGNKVFSIISGTHGIPADLDRDFSITFEPKELGDYVAKLTAETNDAYRSTIEIYLLGTCDGPLARINASPALLLFGGIEVGNTITKQLTIENSGDTTLEISSITVSENDDGSFILPDNLVPLSIEPQDEHEIDITFAPSEVKSFNRELIIVSNAFENEEESVRLRASGRPSSIDNQTTANDIFIRISPNPAKDRITYSIQGIENFNGCAVLYDIMGNEIYRENNINIQKNDIDLSAYPPGVYTLRIKGNNIIKTEKLIIIK